MSNKGFATITIIVALAVLTLLVGGTVVLQKQFLSQKSQQPTPTPYSTVSPTPISILTPQPTAPPKTISCQTDADCPPPLPCLPPNCIGMACVYGECKSVPKEALICDQDSDCAFLDIRSCLAPEMFCGPEKPEDISESKYGPWNRQWCQNNKKEVKRTRQCLGVAYPLTNEQNLKVVCKDYYGKKICQRSK